MKETESIQTVDTNIKILFWKAACFGLGDFGNNFVWTFVGSYLMIFYTDVFGIPMAAVSLLMLIARAWDAINDPIIGGLSDRTRTRWGRYRPWVLLMSFPTAIITVLTFWAHPDWSNTSKIVYMYVTYALLVFCYTGVNIPYSAMTSVLTQNTDERAKLSTMRITLANISIAGIGIIVIPMVSALGKGDAAMGYRLTAVIFVLIFMCCSAVVFATQKEVVPPPVKHKYPLRVQFKSMLANRPFLIAFCGQLLWGFFIHGRGSMYTYYFKYVQGDAGLMSLYNLVGLVPLVAGCYLFKAWYNVDGNKGRVTAYGCIGAGIAMILMRFTSPIGSPVLFYALCAISKFFEGVLASGIYGVIPDTVEYGQLKTGVRNDGFLSAFISLGNKFGIALGSAGVAAILAVLGFQANVTQTPLVSGTINNFFTVIPGILSVLCGIVFLFYKIDRKTFNDILSKLNDKVQSNDPDLV